MEARLAVPLWMIAALLAVVVGYGAIQEVRGPTWRYIVAAPTDEKLIETLNQMGEAGWEVVAARRATNGSGGASYEMILKRAGTGPSVVPEMIERPAGN